MQAHTDTDTHRCSQTDRQADRQTGRHTQTRISNHLPESSPSVEVSQYRAMYARYQILHEGEERANDQGSTQHLHTHF